MDTKQLQDRRRWFQQQQQHDDGENGDGDEGTVLVSPAASSSSLSVSCSVCLEPVSDLGERSVAKLKCGHRFHLDCIGSAFNAKGAMQCPNCRHVEHGQWLYANGCHSYAEFVLEDLSNDDYLFDLLHGERPLGFPWCPYQNPYPQSSLSFDDVEPASNAHADMVVNVLYGEHSTPLNGGARPRVCPYLAAHGLSRLPHMPVSMNNAAPSNNLGDIGDHRTSSVSEINGFASYGYPASEMLHHQGLSSNALNLNLEEHSHERRADTERLHLSGPNMPPNFIPYRYFTNPVNARALASDVPSISQTHGHGRLPPVHQAANQSRGWLGVGTGTSAGTFIRQGEGADSMGWPSRNHFVFPSLPWASWFQPSSQNHQNVTSEPMNRGYYASHHSYFGANAGQAAHVSLDAVSYQHHPHPHPHPHPQPQPQTHGHAYARFASTFFQ